MGYYLQAFICKSSDTNVLRDNFSTSRIIEIGQGISLVPATEELLEELKFSEDGLRIKNFEYLTEEVEKELLKRIGDKQVSYVEAEYFGGEGGQIGILWSNGKRQSISEFGQGQINQILRSFGAIASEGNDEFLTLGLGLRRNTDEWLNNIN